MQRTIAYFAFAILLTVSMAIRTDAVEPTSVTPANQSSIDGDFVVHEWGTFTTFSGSDGVFLDFRPLAASQNDLPDYVFDRGSFSKGIGRLFSKSRLRGRVRMETPVTYFYTDRPRTVEVRVDFPEGLLTEFYPPVRQILPAIDEDNIFGKGELIGKSSLNWGKVDLIPTSELVPNIKDTRIRESIATSIANSLIPHASNEQHYAAARETDAALVHIRDAADTTSYFEKFLFYRGVGKFQLPISTHFTEDRAIISNGGSLPVNSAILISIQGNEIQATRIDHVDAGQSLPFEGLKTMTMEQLAKIVRESLVAEGLYEKEAASMVATWKQSWFAENGTRVLYIVPRATTEELLPLHVTPRPQQMLRVLVGRMEVMSPKSEEKMVQAVARSVTSRVKHDAEKRSADSNSSYAIPSEILAFGRMTEPSLARIASIAKDASIRNEAVTLGLEMAFNEK